MDKPYNYSNDFMKIDPLLLTLLLLTYSSAYGQIQVIIANGKTECTAKKMNCPPIVKLRDNILDNYVGTYSASPHGLFRITKEGSRLKFQRVYSLLSCTLKQKTGFLL